MSIVVLLSFTFACAKKSAPLPGDSVAQDGAVTLTPSRVDVAAPSSDGRDPRARRDADGTRSEGIESKVFPPELAMENQIAIGLTSAQRDSIARETEAAHKDLLKLQWQLDAEKEKLVRLLAEERVDEAKVALAAHEVMKRENAIKIGHLTMLVRIKNTLTKEQQQKLGEIREAALCPPRARSAP